MKRLVSMTLVLAMLLCMCCSCELFPSGGSGSGRDQETTAAKKKTITLHDGSLSKTFEVTVGKQADIDECLRLGYYSKGYYTAPEGGEQYFSADGKSLAVWGENFPTEFYVQYEPVSSLTYTKRLLEDETKTFSWHICAQGDDRKEFENALKANLGKSVKVDISFAACDTYTYSSMKWTVYCKNNSTYSEGSQTAAKTAAQYSGVIIDVDTSYKTYKHTAFISAEELAIGDGLFVFFSRGNTFGSGKLKNITITVSFN